MDILKHNSKAWDHLTEKGDKWTLPVDTGTVEKARQGDWQIVLTPLKPVPRDWFPDDLHGSKVLCLASGGGQQGPVLAAAGASVTVFDNSPKQLEKDREVAERDNLDITTVQGDMKDLSCFADESFDLIVHPVSNVFAENILPVWQEAARVLKTGCAMLSGFFNPFPFIFDVKGYEEGRLEFRYSIPYADTRSLTEAEFKELVLEKNQPVCFGHTLHDQIQGQIAAGMVIAGLYEDKMGGDDPLDPYIDMFIATRAVKMTLP